MRNRRTSSRLAAEALFAPKDDNASPIDSWNPQLPVDVRLPGMTAVQAREALAQRWGLRYLGMPDGRQIAEVHLPIFWTLVPNLKNSWWLTLLDGSARPRARVLEPDFSMKPVREGFVEPLTRFHVSIDFDDSTHERSQIVVRDREVGRVIRRSTWLDGSPGLTEYCRQQMIADMEADFPGFDDPLRYWSDLSISSDRKDSAYRPTQSRSSGATDNDDHA